MRLRSLDKAYVLAYDNAVTTTKVMTTSEVRADIYDIVDDVSKRGISVTITKNGKDAAVLMSAEELESILETLDVLSDKKLVKSVKAGMRDIKKGRTIPLEKLKKELGI